MAAPEPSLRLTGYLTAAVGAVVVLVSGNAEGLGIGSLNHSFGSVQLGGIALGLVVMVAGLAAASRSFRRRYPVVVRSIVARPHMLWLTPRLLLIALAIVVIVMADRGLDAATCPYPGLPNGIGDPADVTGSVIVGDTLVCTYGGGL